jgi:hypothetical protein
MQVGVKARNPTPAQVTLSLTHPTFELAHPLIRLVSARKYDRWLAVVSTFISLELRNPLADMAGLRTRATRPPPICLIGR